jgi:asparagine synthase (glutamine-hydrolysing)
MIDIFIINDGWTKWIMRAAFKDVLPRQIAFRKDKIGYEPPQKNWLENKNVKEKIHESKRKLFDHNVISKKEYENDTVSGNSSGVRNKSWDLWMGGELF